MEGQHYHKLSENGQTNSPQTQDNLPVLRGILIFVWRLSAASYDFRSCPSSSFFRGFCSSRQSSTVRTVLGSM